MQIKNGAVLREIAGNYIVVSVGETGGMVSLTESGAVLFRLLVKGAKREDLIEALLNEYEVEREIAVADVDGFIEKLKEAKLLK